MTGPEDMWVAHTIAAIGLTLKIFAPWPLLPMSEAGGAGIYQPVADTSGIVFVRHGPEDTVEKYIGKLGGMFTQVSVIEDVPTTVSGREARRVTIRLVTPAREVYDGDTSTAITHRTLREERTRICVVAFSNRGIPILGGYRMPEESLARYRVQLEKILNSISVS